MDSANFGDCGSIFLRTSARSALRPQAANLCQATLVTSNLPFDEGISIFGSERLTGALMDRLTHLVHIFEINGDGDRLVNS